MATFFKVTSTATRDAGYNWLCALRHHLQSVGCTGATLDSHLRCEWNHVERHDDPDYRAGVINACEHHFAGHLGDYGAVGSGGGWKYRDRD